MKLGRRLKERAAACKSQLHALLIACRDPRTPWYAKALAGAIVAYALSPIDLIPDFIPVLGYLDDIILLPLGVVLVIRMIPAEVMSESRVKARAHRDQRLPRSTLGTCIVVSIWLVGLVAVGVVAVRAWGS